MGLPSESASAYDASSAVHAAQSLNGDLFVVHGTSDDNVHMANSVALLQQTIAADRAHVQFMAYPGQRHGFTALADLQNLYERMLDWWTAHL